MMIIMMIKMKMVMMMVMVKMMMAMMPKKTNKHDLVGVVSWGDGCAAV